MQAKLHRWAAADAGRRFDDLFNFVHDPATLSVAFGRVAGNRGAHTPGVDGLTVADVAEITGVPGFLDDLRAQLKAGTFTPMPVRERVIPKPGGSGKVRKLGIPSNSGARRSRAASAVWSSPTSRRRSPPPSTASRPVPSATTPSPLPKAKIMKCCDDPLRPPPFRHGGVSDSELGRALDQQAAFLRKLVAPGVGEGDDIESRLPR
jgi:hypothetical protein